MLSDLFKPAWKSRSLENRLRTIREMDSGSAEHQKMLLKLAREDEDRSIRIAAVQQLNTVADLHDLSDSISDDAVRIEAEQRVDKLLATNHSLDETQYLQLQKRYPELGLRIAAHAYSRAVRIEALSQLPSRQMLELLEITEYTDCRQFVAEKLSNIEDLEAARKIMRGKDKNAERTIRAKIDLLRRHDRELIENKARVEKLIEEAEYLAVHDWLPEFMVRCQTHCQQWDNLILDIDDDCRRRYRVAREVVDKNYQRQRVVEHARQSQQKLFDNLEAQLQLTAMRGFSDSIDALTATGLQHQQFSHDWLTQAEITPVDEGMHKQYRKMLNALQAAIEFVSKAGDLDRDAMDDSGKLAANCQKLEVALKDLQWPDEFTDLQVAAELKQRLLNWRKEQNASAQAYEKKLAGVHKNISAIFRFSRAGNLQRAEQTAGKVTKALNQFGGRDLLALQVRFDDARKTLGDMGDWKNFATEPKYLELCESMELLADSKHHPDKRSQDMKALQQQWKALGHSEISDQYWPRFKLAADKVYQPCAEFFEQRHELRKTNLEQRQQFLEQMRALLEEADMDSSPDYKVLQSNVRSINDKFTRIKDVERKAGQKQWKQFSALKDRLNEKLQVVYNDNIALKQQLIRQAEALAEAAAKVENLDAFKSLQARWNQVGVTRRNEDQKAWKAFKKQGDIVYGKVNDLRRSQRDEIDQQLNAYREIIKSIQKLAKTASDLTEADQQLSVLQANYDALPELPRQLPEKLGDGIRRDYRNACDQYDKRHVWMIENRHIQQIDALRVKANLCTELEALGSAPSEKQLRDIAQQWDSIELHNAELARRIEARRNSAQSDIDRVAIAAERRLLCIQLEIAVGAESPEEDRDLRMQYQLEQMNKLGLGRQAVDSNKLIETMELNWLCMPGAVAVLQKTLDVRFQKALQSVDKKH